MDGRVRRPANPFRFNANLKGRIELSRRLSGRRGSAARQRKAGRRGNGGNPEKLESVPHKERSFWRGSRLFLRESRKYFSAGGRFCRCRAVFRNAEYACSLGAACPAPPALGGFPGLFGAAFRAAGLARSAGGEGQRLRYAQDAVLLFLRQHGKIPHCLAQLFVPGHSFPLYAGILHSYAGIVKRLPEICSLSESLPLLSEPCSGIVVQ